jgi:N-methylhydantoinase A/oxoprolinase/acetone carboxylase beta subunit
VKRIGIDIGGTFTDLVLWDDETCRRYIHKLASTPDDHSRAGVQGILALCEKAGVSLGEVDLILHGTTVATNTLLEGKGAVVALITNEGFRDILHIGRKSRPFNFAHNQDLPRQTRPLVERRFRFGIPGRISAPTGAEIEPLDESAVLEVAKQIQAEPAVNAVAICCLHAYLNAQHEQRIAEIVRELCPDVFVSVSHDIVSLYREYERMSTTALNAYVGPGTSAYLSHLSDGLRKAGFGADLCLMTSAGGVIGVDEAAKRPVSLLLSGPVGALVAGIQCAEELDIENVITLDVGGTSADIGVAPQRELRMKHILDNQIAGYDAMLPMCDIGTIGAGGGSIAWIDAGGMFRVGPHSAGADPGPACYGQGGERPTVTDALVTMGWYRQDALLESGLEIRPELAEAAIRRDIAEPLGLTVEQAATGILEIAVHSMAEAVRVGSVARGFDPREFSLIGYGGAGGAFAVPVAQQLNIRSVVIPPTAGVGAAGGLLCTDMHYSRQTTVWQQLDQANTDSLLQHMDGLALAVTSELVGEGLAQEAISVRFVADCRYAGQGYELSVALPNVEENVNLLDALAAAFHSAHRQAYQRAFEDKPVMLVNLRAVGVGQIPPIGRLEWMPTPGKSGAVTGKALFSKGNTPEWSDTQYFKRDSLKPGTRIVGPAILEQLDTTTVVPPGACLSVLPDGHLVIELQEALAHAA